MYYLYCRYSESANLKQYIHFIKDEPVLLTVYDERVNVDAIRANLFTYSNLIRTNKLVHVQIFEQKIYQHRRRETRNILRLFFPFIAFYLNVYNNMIIIRHRYIPNNYVYNITIQ